MARSTAAKKLDHLKYIGPHPHVTVREAAGVVIAADFVRGEATGPFDDEVLEALAKKEGEFVRVAAPDAPAEVSTTTTSGEGGSES